MIASGDAPARRGLVAGVSHMCCKPAPAEGSKYKSAPASNKAPHKRKRGPKGPRRQNRSAIGWSEARPARGAAAAGSARGGLWLHRQEPFALHAFAGELAGPADRLRLLTGLLFRWFLVVAAKLHLAENPLALHFLLQRLEGLVDVVVPDKNLHAVYLFRVTNSPANAPAAPSWLAGRVAEWPRKVHRPRG